MFHAQVGNRNRTDDVLNVATSIFHDGVERFEKGDLTAALALFEQVQSHCQTVDLARDQR